MRSLPFQNTLPVAIDEVLLRIAPYENMGRRWTCLRGSIRPYLGGDGNTFEKTEKQASSKKQEAGMSSRKRWETVEDDYNRMILPYYSPAVSLPRPENAAIPLIAPDSRRED